MSTGSLSAYLGRVTSEHRPRPNFIATLTAVLNPLIQLQNTLNAMSSAFDIDQAVGPQLDAVGLWLGVSRVIQIPATSIYFAWNISNQGWNQGVWDFLFAPTTQAISLDDPTFRSLLILRTSYQNWNGTRLSLNEILNGGGTLAGGQIALPSFGGPTGLFSTNGNQVNIAIVDNFNMSITYQLYSQPYGGGAYNNLAFTPELQSMFFAGTFTDRPAGVSNTLEIWNATTNSFQTAPFTP